MATLEGIGSKSLAVGRSFNRMLLARSLFSPLFFPVRHVPASGRVLRRGPGAPFHTYHFGVHVYRCRCCLLLSPCQIAKLMSTALSHLPPGLNSHMAAHELSRRYRKEGDVNGVRQILAQVRPLTEVRQDCFLNWLQYTVVGCKVVCQRKNEGSFILTVILLFFV